MLRTVVLSGSSIGRVVGWAMAVGLLGAIAVVVAPVLPARGEVLIGAVLLSFAAGWLLLSVLSVALTSQPQWWAAAPAVFLTVAGVVSVAGSASVQNAYRWVWPPVLLAVVIMMTVHVRRLRSRGARRLLSCVVAVLTVATIGGGYETVSEAYDEQTYPAPGRLVDIGGHRLHLRCTGAGTPTVVLEPGLGGSSTDMSWIAPVVARHTTVCVYDRAGRGWSDPTVDPQDADHIAEDLHTLLTSAGVDGPYVLAGHSFGGLYVLDFAARFPDQVAGVVLLDSTAPRRGQATARPSTAIDRFAAMAPAVANFGVARLVAHVSYHGWDRRTLVEARANASTAGYLASYLSELLDGSASVRQASALSDLGRKPLLVLTATRGHDAAWQSDQDRLVDLSSNALHRLAPGTTHASMVDEQTASSAAGQAVLDVVSAVRTGEPLVGH